MDQRREALGRAVRYARSRAGVSSLNAFETLVKERTGEDLSYRMLGDLERGVKVGKRTVDLAALALGWPPSLPYAILEGTQSVGAAGELSEASPPEAAEQSGLSLQDVSNEELVAELLRRLQPRATLNASTPLLTASSRGEVTEPRESAPATQAEFTKAARKGKTGREEADATSEQLERHQP